MKQLSKQQIIVQIYNWNKILQLMYNTGNSISVYFLMLNPARWNGSTKREKSEYIVKKCYTFVGVIQQDRRKLHKAATALIAQVQLG